MSWINMLTPMQWLLLAAIPPAILSLYFLKLKRRESLVPSTLLWTKAIEVFQNNTVPKFYLQMLRIYPQAEDLPDEARDALISLVFNRGTALSGERRSEMLGIQNAMRDRRFYDVPALMRSMKRLWPNTKGLQRRRDAEAELFEKALEPKRKR